MRGARTHQNVSWLEIAMNDALVMQPVQTARDVFRERQHALDRELLAACRLRRSAD